MTKDTQEATSSKTHTASLIIEKSEFFDPLHERLIAGPPKPPAVPLDCKDKLESVKNHNMQVATLRHNIVTLEAANAVADIKPEDKDANQALIDTHKVNLPIVMETSLQIFIRCAEKTLFGGWQQEMYTIRNDQKKAGAPKSGV